MSDIVADDIDPGDGSAFSITIVVLLSASGALMASTLVSERVKAILGVLIAVLSTVQHLAHRKTLARVRANIGKQTV